MQRMTKRIFKICTVLVDPEKVKYANS